VRWLTFHSTFPRHRSKELGDFLLLNRPPVRCDHQDPVNDAIWVSPWRRESLDGFVE
jgi:hypothetical protein